MSHQVKGGGVTIILVNTLPSPFHQHKKQVYMYIYDLSVGFSIRFESLSDSWFGCALVVNFGTQNFRQDPLDSDEISPPINLMADECVIIDIGCGIDVAIINCK